jgi:two-component sensor histidine kinase
MLNEPDSTKLSLLAEIQRLALHGDDLAVVLQGAAAPLRAGLGADRIAILSQDAGGTLPVVAGAEPLPGAAGRAAMFEIAADGISHGILRVERPNPLTDGDRLFASLAAGLLAVAFIRLGTATAPSETLADLAADRVPPAAELIHRVRNILSVIRVIVRRTAERTKSVEEYAAQLEGRVSALARVQTALIASQGYSTDIGTVIDDQMVAHSIRENRVRAQGPRIPLKAKAAETLGLTVHELIENAIKFGALSAKDGRIDVTWWVEEDVLPRQLRLDWIESGVPVLAAAPRVRGFGHELIERTLPYELSAKASVDFQPGGFRCALAIPLIDRVIYSDTSMVQ